MNVAEWTLVVILSTVLLIFLILGIILIIKLLGMTKEAKKIVITGQNIAEKADNVVENVKEMTAFGGAAKAFAGKIFDSKLKSYTRSTNAKKKGAKNGKKS